MLVLIAHWGIYYERGTVQFDAIRVVVPWGKFGWAFFFVLSGYLISSVLFKARNDMAEGDSKVGIIKNFLMRRIMRIWPPYYLLLLILWLLNNTIMKEYPWYFLTHTSNILVYRTQKPNGLIHLWSLSLQEQFYLILPWFIMFMNIRLLKWVLYAAIAFGIVSKYYAMFFMGKQFPFLLFQSFDSLCLGVLYAYYVYIDKHKQFEKVIKFMLPILLYFGWQMATRFRGTMFGVIYERTMWNYMGLAIIIFTINNNNKWLQKYFFENKFMNYFGKISFGIYLYHFSIGNYFDYHYGRFLASHQVPYIFTNFIVIYVVKIALVLIVAALSYNYFEAPIIAMKNKFNYLKKKNVAVSEPE